MCEFELKHVWVLIITKCLLPWHGAMVALVSMLPRGFLYKDITYSQCELDVIIITIITIIDKCTYMPNESSIEKEFRW